MFTLSIAQIAILFELVVLFFTTSVIYFRKYRNLKQRIDDIGNRHIVDEKVKK